MDKEKLTAALDKKAMYGNDIDLNAYNDTNEARTKSVDELSQATRDRLEYVGIETGAAEEENRSASFVQLDNNAVEVKVKKQTPLELMSTGKAAEKYPELVEKYWWKAVKPDTDKYTAKTALEQEQGYFIRVRAGQKITTPLQACMCISHDQQLQHVHNVIIIEDGAELSIISGCTSAHEVESGMHIGISEMYIGKNAKLSFTMIHSWGENVIVRPRTVALVEEGGQYISNYVSIEKAKDGAGGRRRAVYFQLCFHRKGEGRADVPDGAFKRQRRCGAFELHSGCAGRFAPRYRRQGYFKRRRL